VCGAWAAHPGTLTDSGDLSSNTLLVSIGRSLVKFGFLYPGSDYAEGFFQEARCLFAIGPLEAHGVDLNISPWRDDDFDGWFHAAEMLSLMEPFCCCERWTRCPFLRASRIALWTP